MKLWIMRILTWFALRGKLYFTWSRIYQFLFEHSHINKNIPVFVSLDGIIAILRTMEWRKDTWVMLFDAISHPHATFTRHSLGKKAGDCDDISLFAARAIESSRRRGYLSGVKNVGFLSVPWIDHEGKTGGHNVCTFSYVKEDIGKTRWAHVSNWYHGAVIRDFETLEDVVRNVLQTYVPTGKSRVSVGWSFVDTSLRLIMYDKGSGL